MNDNIWNQFSFNEKHQKSALDYLNDLKSGLSKETRGELLLETEAVDSYIDMDPIRIAAIYKLFVVAPKLGNFRRKILSVAEYSELGRFPVDIINHFDNDRKFHDVLEIQFEKKISEILTNPIVKNSIENLFQQSKEHSKRNLQ